MHKREQLIEYIIQDIIEYQCEDDDLDILSAMARFYNSTVFEKLQDTETGLYLAASAYVYELFRSELEHGRLIRFES
jgi:hypothetical protein